MRASSWPMVLIVLFALAIGLVAWRCGNKQIIVCDGHTTIVEIGGSCPT